MTNSELTEQLMKHPGNMIIGIKAEDDDGSLKIIGGNIEIEEENGCLVITAAERKEET